MRKIMFNDKYGLTQAVLESRKTVTRRIIPQKIVDQYKLPCWQATYKSIREWLLANSTYKVGEIIAIAQAYKDIFKDAYHIGLYGRTAGWTNKMFVKAELMPHHIKITNIRVEQLQEISNEDCLKEGIRKWADADPMYKKTYQGENLYEYAGSWDGFRTPRQAFAELIDKISGNGTWVDNPYVFVYEFELINSKE